MSFNLSGERQIITSKLISKQDVLFMVEIQMSPGNFIMKGFKCL